ncbi:YggS family pyridoxal phosphate-dependent enzyme [Kordiimonas pumila]|uniref:Pyridoxal phosphate homeostasis protein n=1 Tax=Kordiimonas pumila TaxID=2161677 RepID=A0ABV7D934_9PROT|nr:YggS family pyridoxal phosphate-dependent enzyme [Kordiimonas pumila]
MTTDLVSTIKANLAEIDSNIRKMAVHTGTKHPAPKLIAVSKVQPDDRVEAALNAGHRVYGENRVQEAESRWKERRKAYPDLELHLIGGLQTNKAAEAVALFDYIHSVDRPKLVKALATEMKKQEKFLPVYIQVNTGREDQKSGCLQEDIASLLGLCTENGLTVLGLMCIPPVDDDPSLHFALLRKLALKHGLKHLSMGMSGDYALAASMGATDIRVGTAVFGARDYG